MTYSNTNTPAHRTSRIKLGVSTIQKQTKEIWIDGPRSQTFKSPVHNILTPAESINFNEIWIDGPKAQENIEHQSKQKSNRAKHLQELDNMSAFLNSRENPQSNNNSNLLECPDRALLRQLNEQDADIIDNFVFNIDSNSRPISLLSVNSNDHSTSVSISTVSTANENKRQSTDEITLLSTDSVDSNMSYAKKLESLKAGYDQMIFKQSCKPTESLHKTLESFLSLESQNSDFTIKPIKSKTEQVVSLRSNLMSDKEKDKRLSRILSPTRFRPVPHIQEYQPASPTGSSSSSSCSSSLSSSSSATPPSYTPNSSFYYPENSTTSSNSPYQPQLDPNRPYPSTNRLFFNFNSNSNGFYFNDGTSLPSSPAHNFNSLSKVKLIKNLNSNDNSVSVPSTPNLTRKTSNPINFKVLKQKANSITDSVTACGGGRATTVSNTVNNKGKDSILNRIFNRSKSKSKLGVHGSTEDGKLSLETNALLTNLNKSNQQSALFHSTAATASHRLGNIY